MRPSYASPLANSSQKGDGRRFKGRGFIQLTGSDAEIALVQTHVTFDGKQQILLLSPDVTMTADDVGVVSFTDINFDNFPDVAISTSFGVANQYFDYWTYDAKLKTYKSIGNYPKLSANRAKKILTANVKLNAAAYEAQSYSWEKGKLVRRKQVGRKHRRAPPTH